MAATLTERRFNGPDWIFERKVDGIRLLALRARLGALEIAAPPFTRGTGLPRRGAHWVKPELVVEVAFIEWTAHDKLRHARLLRLREDRAARSVARTT
jgi:bifunctional non-homologous end joining protein LigD